MAGSFTIDASVFLNGFNPAEPGHPTSFEFLSRVQTEAVPAIVPTLLLPEVAAAIGRGQGNSDLARQFAETLSSLPHRKSSLKQLSQFLHNHLVMRTSSRTWLICRVLFDSSPGSRRWQKVDQT